MTDKPIAWSDSRLNDFDTCMYRGYRRHVTRDAKGGGYSPAQAQGNDDHEKLQGAILHGARLPEHLSHRAQAVLSFREEALRGNFVVAEYQLSINQHLQKTGWFDDDAWGRSKKDVFIHRTAYMPPDAKAPIYIRDWKSGKVRDDWQKQASRYAFFALVCYPEADSVHVEIDYYNQGENGEGVVKDMVYGREALTTIAKPIFAILRKIRDAQVSGDWPTSKTGLCRGYCPVSDCMHWEPKRG